MHSRLSVALVLTLGLLSACGGGPVCCVDTPSAPSGGGAGGGGTDGGGTDGGGTGGGGGTDGGAPPSFTRFDRTPDGRPVRADAIAQDSSTLPPDFGAQATMTLDDEDFTRLEISSARGSASWSGEEEIRCSGTRCMLRDGDDARRNAGRVVRPDAFDWNYQTFGYWVNDRESASRAATAVSFGNRTPAGVEVSRSRATYEGRARGVYEERGTLLDLDARLRAAVDFGRRIVDFSTSSSRTAPFGSDSFRGNRRLDMEGSLAITEGYRFSGTVRTDGGVLEGTAAGSFYGPDAQEIGGTFSLRGDDSSLTGGFGGRR